MLTVIVWLQNTRGQKRKLEEGAETLEAQVKEMADMTDEEILEAFLGWARGGEAAAAARAAVAGAASAATSKKNHILDYVITNLFVQ